MEAAAEAGVRVTGQPGPKKCKAAPEKNDIADMIGRAMGFYKTMTTPRRVGATMEQQS
jgi:hypothetical protein